MSSVMEPLTSAARKQWVFSYVFSSFFLSLFSLSLKIDLDLEFEVDLGFGGDENGEKILKEIDGLRRTMFRMDLVLARDNDLRGIRY